MSTTAAPIGQFALNFARNKDPQIQSDLDKARSDPSQANRIADYKDVAKRFGQDVPYLWLTQTLWQVASATNVHGIAQKWTMPDGSPGTTQIQGGSFLPALVWVG